MSLEGPPTPVDEYSTTSVPIPPGATLEEIEETVLDVHGKVNIVGNIMTRDMPECSGKAGISVKWGQIYGNFNDANGYYCVGGTGGTTYMDGSMLSPDIALWDFKDLTRKYTIQGGAFEHLMQHAPAPNWILEYEWASEVVKEGKGIDKVENLFFTKVGTNGTTVNEAWILVKHQDIDPVPEPPPIGYILRSLRWLSDAPFIGFLLFWPLLWLLDRLSGTNRYTGRTVRRNGPPTMQNKPYFIVYFRENPHNPYGYYWLEWHEKFYPPPGSVYYFAPGLPVDTLLKMMTPHR